MDILIADLYENGARFGEQLSCDREPIAKNRQVGMNPELPGVPESPHLLWLTSSVLHLAVFNVALASADLPVRPELDSVGRVDVDGCDRAGAKDYAAFLGFFSLEPS